MSRYRITERPAEPRLFLPDRTPIEVDIYGVPEDVHFGLEYVSPIIPENRTPYVTVQYDVVERGPSNLRDWPLVSQTMSAEERANLSFPLLPVCTGMHPGTTDDEKCTKVAKVLKNWSNHRDIDDFVNRLPGFSVLCAHVRVYDHHLSNGCNGRMSQISLCDGNAIARAYAALV